MRSVGSLSHAVIILVIVCVIWERVLDVWKRVSLPLYPIHPISLFSQVGKSSIVPVEEHGEILPLLVGRPFQNVLSPVREVMSVLIHRYTLSPSSDPYLFLLLGSPLPRRSSLSSLYCSSREKVYWRTRGMNSEDISLL